MVLIAKEEQKSELKELLGPEETVINPHYMRQLLEYGLRMAAHQGPIDLEQEAQVRFLVYLSCTEWC